MARILLLQNKKRELIHTYSNRIKEKLEKQGFKLIATITGFNAGISYERKPK